MPFCTGKGWFADANTKSNPSLAITSVYLTHTLLLNASVCCCKQYSITGMGGEDLLVVAKREAKVTHVGGRISAGSYVNLKHYTIACYEAAG